MKKETSRYISTYYATGNYYVDVVKEQVGTKWGFEAWIYNKDYGIKSLMFGDYSYCITLNDFIQLVRENIMDYITDYKKRFED